MAIASKLFHFHPSLLLLLVMTFLSIHDSQQLKSSEFDTLLRIQRDLNFPSALSSWNKHTDFCNNTDSNPSSSSSSSNVVCYEDTITQLHIIGERKPPLLLPQNFSMDSLITALSSLPNLKVLTLVSLGMWGPLPPNISLLSSLEILNMSSNYLFGTIPQELSSLTNLQTLILDGNMFSGVIPYWIDDSFPALAVLSLRDNRFNGSLPDSLGSLENLRILSLSNNHFHGEVPDLSPLRNLQVLELDGNGFGPQFPRLGKKLVSVVLRNNSFRSGIPSEVTSYYQLERLDMSENTFVGPFQPALLSLPSITYLNISGNKLTGMVFENLSCNSELKAVDLSMNLLTGRLPRCLLSNPSDRIVRYAGNCLDGADQNQNPPPLCHTEALAVGILPERNKHRRLSKLVLSIGIAGGTIGGVALIALIFFVVKRGNDRSRMRNPPTRFISENAASGYTSKLLSDARYISQTMKLGAAGLPSYRTFSLEEIEAATNYFDTTSFMGEGSHGQMYRGRLKNGSLVAIKCVKMRKGQSTQSFMQHIELISKLRHRNLVSALGHCFECYLDDSSVSRIFLVFEYVPNGTLKSWISDDNPTKSLNWSQRIAAAIGVAKGIQFLHTGILPGVYSNNLRITDILLDQNLVAKISSYNLPLLSKMGKVGHGNSSSKSKSHSSANKSVKHEDKSDIYDFGVILLEVILGRTTPSKNDVDALKNLLQASIVAAAADARKSVVDPAIRKACLDQSLKTMMEICVRCLMKEAEDRPSIEDVLWNLQFAAQVQDAWRVDSQSSSSSSVGSPGSPLEPPRLAFQ